MRQMKCKYPEGMARAPLANSVWNISLPISTVHSFTKVTCIEVEASLIIDPSFSYSIPNTYRDSTIDSHDCILVYM